MEEILDSIVVDPFVFYAVLIGIIVVLAIILMFILRSKHSVKKTKKYHKIEPIVLEDNVDIMNIDSKESEKSEIVNKDQIKPKNEIKDLLTVMEQDLQKEIPKISNYEDDQEEKAIISYQQLLAAKNKLESEIKIEEDPLPTVSKVTIENAFDFDFQEEVSKETVVAPAVEPVVENHTDVKKFKNSEFISPIFGRDSIDEYYSSRHGKAAKETQVKETVKPKTVSEPAARGDDFLSSLKEFRRNLD